jgi:hypothetical protein
MSTSPKPQNRTAIELFPMILVIRLLLNPHGPVVSHLILGVTILGISGNRLLWWYLLLWCCHGGSWEGFCRFRLPHSCSCAYLTPHPLPLPILDKRPKYSVRCHITDTTSRNMSDTLNRSYMTLVRILNSASTMICKFSLHGVSIDTLRV